MEYKIYIMKHSSHIFIKNNHSSTDAHVPSSIKLKIKWKFKTILSIMLPTTVTKSWSIQISTSTIKCVSVSIHRKLSMKKL